MNQLINKISTTNPKPSPGDLNNKRQWILSESIGKCYMDCLYNMTLQKKLHLRDKIQEKEEKIEVMLKVDIYHWSNWKFHLY